jgi:hypothetical protein
MQWRSGPLVAAAALAAGAALAAAQSPPAALQACTRISQDSERLACFDREVAALSGHAATKAPVGSAAANPAAAAAATTPADAHTGGAGAGTAAAPLTPEQKLGLSGEGVRTLEARQGIKTEKVKGLTAHITSVSRNASGRLVLTLDNGQVWRQAESRSTFEAGPGDVATISPGALGSFFLATNSHNWTRVERIP